MEAPTIRPEQPDVRAALAPTIGSEAVGPVITASGNVNGDTRAQSASTDYDSGVGTLRNRISNFAIVV